MIEVNRTPLSNDKNKEAFPAVCNKTMQNIVGGFLAKR